MRILPLGSILLLCLTLPKIGLACTCAPPKPGESEEITVQDYVKRSDVVFRGEIVAHKWHAAVFRVREQWKGNLKSHVRLEWRRGDRGDCNGFWPDDLKVGEELLVFATKGHFGRYRTSICLPTSLVSKAEAETKLRVLGPGKPPVK